jgi:hypothetical protein
MGWIVKLTFILGPLAILMIAIAETAMFVHGL